MEQATKTNSSLKFIGISFASPRCANAGGKSSRQSARDAKSMQRSCHEIALRDELVADSMDGLDVFRPRRVALQLGADAGHMIVHGTACRVRLNAPDFVEKLVARHHLARACCQQAHHRKLFACHLDTRSVATGLISP